MNNCLNIILVVVSLIFLTVFSYEVGKKTVMIEAIDMNVAQYNAQTGQFEWKVQ